jgi:hypothetical protein
MRQRYPSSSFETAKTPLLRMRKHLTRGNMTDTGNIVVLSPLPACGERSARIARCATGEGDIRESEHVESAPHPDPLRASFARLDPACGEREFRGACTGTALD